MRRGFSLLEILMAVAILGTSIVVVVGHVNHGVMMYRVARETVLATALARGKLNELVTPPPGESVRTGSESGVFDEDQRFSYQTVISEAELPGIDKSDLPGLYRAEVTVSWKHDVVRSIHLVQLIPEKPVEDKQ